MLSREDKNKRISELETEFKESKHFIFLNYKGLTFEQISNLRARLKETNSKLKVIKNSLAKIACSRINFNYNEDWFKGENALIFIKDDDFVKCLKVLYDFLKENEVLKIKFGIIENKIYEFDKLKQISQLPTYNELVGNLVVTLNSPVVSLVLNLQGVIKKLILTLKAIEKSESKEVK